MTTARIGYRTNQRQALEDALHEIDVLKKENQQLKEQIVENT
jgi:hypothetical protein